MTKDFQEELLEKVKPGMKPSDLKKDSKKQPKKTISPSPIEISNEQPRKPVKKPLPNQDEGYSSDPTLTPTPSEDGYSSSEEEKPILTLNPTISKNQTKTPASVYVLDLEKQIRTLEKQLQLYKDFKEADLRIKENLKKENQALKKTISELKSKEKATGEPQPEPVKTFLCSDCNQTKPQPELSRVFGQFSFCLSCSKKARQQATKEKSPEPQPTEFTCHSCQQTKTELPNKMKLDETLQTYLICSTCRPTFKEFNEADLITDEL
jgi:hypothetical protein